MAIAIAIANNVFLDRLRDNVVSPTHAISPDAVIAAGAGGLSRIASSPEMLETIKQAYVVSLRDVFVFALVAACVAFPCAWGMEWLNIKTVAKERERAAERNISTVSLVRIDSTATNGKSEADSSKDSVPGDW